MISVTGYDFPDISMALVGQTSAQRPHILQSSVSVTIPSDVNLMAFSVQAITQVPHLMHFAGAYILSTSFETLSGLWHQAQLRLQPFRKITILIPGPSLIDRKST